MVSMTENVTALAFNEWMRRYIEEPERFEREIVEVRRFLIEDDSGEPPSYGSECAAYLDNLITELTDAR
jgi:hypothetical protein